MGDPINRRSPLPTGTLPTPMCSIDPRLSYISPSQLCGRRDAPLAVSFPALEEAIRQLSIVTTLGGRRLYLREQQIVEDIFQTSVDTSRVRVVEARIANAPTTLGSYIRIVPGFDFLTEDNKATLVHEMTHVWQYQHFGNSYITDALFHQISSMAATGTRNAAYMNYQLGPDRSFSSFAAEEQATIVEDYYSLTRRYQNDTNPPPWVVLRRPDLPQYERLMVTVRQAVPLADVELYQRTLMPGLTPTRDPMWDTHDRDVIQVVPLFRLTF